MALISVNTFSAFAAAECNAVFALETIEKDDDDDDDEEEESIGKPFYEIIKEFMEKIDIRSLTLGRESRYDTSYFEKAQGDMRLDGSWIIIKMRQNY